MCQNIRERWRCTFKVDELRCAAFLTSVIMRRQAPMVDAMRWSEPAAARDGQEGPPTIKNHSVTHFNGHLYCFGGYDGRRNHMALILYSIKRQRWIRPQPAMELGGDWPSLPSGDQVPEPVTYTGTPPGGRNGHTATLATDPVDEETGRIIIIGGWLGTGPLAASDLHVLDVTGGGTHLRWYQPPVRGEADGPGPCNMHSADFIPESREVYVFRGGNGREYLNDLHALNVDSFEWRRVETTGPTPQQRANHSSAFLEETGELFIFGGWNGIRRLNDIHILDVATSTWTCPHVGGVLPHPRAGMTLTAIRDRLYLFGGSGTSSKCFNDLQVLDRHEMAWLDVVHDESPDPPRSRFEYDHALDDSNHQQHSDQLTDVSAPDDRNFGSHRVVNWRTSHEEIRQGPVYAAASPNPNDEETVSSVLVYGRSPGRRAGHTATSMNRRIFIFGGSCGSDYLNDFFVLDTDPPPRAVITQPASLQLFERRIRHFFNDEEFSDVTFLVEGQSVYGHKMVLSIVSDCFRAMFTTGFRESEAGAEIEIPECSYDTFLSMMEYIYTGQTRRLQMSSEGDVSIDGVVELLELADQFFLDHLIQLCESALQSSVNADTVEYLHQVAIKTNAAQLAYICEHYFRNQESP